MEIHFHVNWPLIRRITKGWQICHGVTQLVLVFFINPIGASEVDPGCIDFKPGDQPIHNTLLREGPPP